MFADSAENQDISFSMSDSVHPGNVRARGRGLWPLMSGDETTLQSGARASSILGEASKSLKKDY